MPLPSIPKARRLTRKESCDYLLNEHGIRRTPGTLANQAATGEGPEFQKDGNRTLHTTEALDAYAEKQLTPLVKSTAELRELTATGDGDA